jgi:serine/threonine-protein kinase
LLALVARAGSLATKDELLSEVWAGTFVEEANLSYTVSLLRKALGEEGYIETVPKSGYRFIAPVSVVGAAPAEATLPDSAGGKTRNRSNARWLTALVTPGLLTDSAWMPWKPGFSRSSEPITRGRRWTGLMPWGIAAVALAVAVAVAWRSMDRELPTQVYASIDVPADYVLGDDSQYLALPTRTPMVFTPDGRSLIIQAARAGKPQLFLRPLDSGDARPIAGTDGALVPFVSPDGKWVGFWSAPEIRKVPIEGGSATPVCALAPSTFGPYGAAWGAQDVIVFGDSESRRIMRVPAGGGTPVPVTSPPPIGRRHVAPFFFPDGRRILFSDVSTLTDASDSHLMLQALDGGDARLVIKEAADGRLLPSGQLVFMRLGRLMTAPFDMVRAEVTGDAVVAMGEVMQSGLRVQVGADNTAAGMFAVSSRGTLAVVRGSLIGPPESRLIWVGRDGQSSSAEPLKGVPAGRRGSRRINPDGSRAIVTVGTAMRPELWIADWARDAWTACRDCNSETAIAVWSHDGTRLLLSRNDTLVAHTLDSSAPDEVKVQETGRVLNPSAWRKDGRIVYQSSPDRISWEIKLLEAGSHAGRTVVPLGLGRESEVSPDGRWLAYYAPPQAPRAGEVRAGEVMVQAFPGPGLRTQISAGGGFNPAWSADGRILYYLGVKPESAVFAVEITQPSVLTRGRPRELFHLPGTQACVPSRCYDVSADGQRFLFRETVGRASVTRMDLVLNWTATLPRGR